VAKNPRNSTTFFRAEAGDLPFGKDCGLRKECAYLFDTTNNPKSLVAALDKTADLDRMRFLRKLSHLKGESPPVLLNFALADTRLIFVALSAVRRRNKRSRRPSRGFYLQRVILAENPCYLGEPRGWTAASIIGIALSAAPSQATAGKAPRPQA
jgi:hypothetical protein